MVESCDPTSSHSDLCEDSVSSIESANTIATQPGGDARRLWLGRALIVVAALLWSTSGFFAKAPIFENWPLEVRGGLLVFWRAAFASAVLIFFVRKIEWSWKLVPVSLIFAAMNWTYLNSLVYGEATLAIWMQYTAPMWVFLFGLIWLKEKPIVKDWILLGFAALGLVVILFSEVTNSSSIALTWGIASGLFFACVVLTLRWCREFDAAWIVFLNHAVACLVFLPNVWQAQVYPAGSQWIYLLAFGALQMGIPYVLFTRALQTVSSHEASGLALLEPILVPVWVFVAWNHSPLYTPPAITTLIGGGLICTGLVIRYWPKLGSEPAKNL